MDSLMAIHSHFFIDDMFIQIQKIKNAYYPDPRVEWYEIDKYINYMLEDIMKDGEPEDWLVELGMDLQQAYANVERIQKLLKVYTIKMTLIEPPRIVNNLLIIKYLQN